MQQNPITNREVNSPEPTGGKDMGLFKKTISARDLGESIAHLVIQQSKELDLSEFDGEINTNRLRSELYGLFTFAADYVTYQKLGGNSPQKNSLLDAFYNALMNGTNPNRGILESRLATYGEAIQTPPPQAHLHPWWELGKAFAKSCDLDMDAKYAMMGILQFSNMANGIADTYDKYKIKA